MVFSKIIDENDNFCHEVVCEENVEYGDFFKQLPKLKIVDFEIDNFQKHSHLCLEKYENIVLAAHTGSGKTIAARYAIELALKEGNRVVYTGPIKSLVNQKYNEFKEIYPNKVGLITGDTVINPEKEILVMVTEVLANMVAKNGKQLENVTSVVFDEAHFIGDIQRGKIWELSIIFCPDNINLLLLSATIENSKHVALWLSKIKNKPCHLIKTKRRFVPLEYYMYSCKDEIIYTIKDKDDKIYNAALKKFKNEENPGGVNKRNLCNILEKLTNANYIPALFYCSSRKSCDSYAQLVNFKFDLLNDNEKENMLTAINGTIEKYSDKELLLDEIFKYKEMFMNGIAVHHSGLMKITRDFIEKCLEYKHIKAIFTTETLAVGLNCPVSACVFTNFMKFDGLTKRYYNYNEFTQMAGRAGRRGIDEKGIVVVIANKNLNIDKFEKFLKMKTSPINSHLSMDYGLVLIIYKIRNFRKFLSNSFRNFQKKNLQDDIELYIKRKDVLKKLDFMKNDGNLTRKGLVAASISYNSGTLIIGEIIENTDMLSSNILNTAAFLSLFVCPKDPSKNNGCTKAALQIKTIFDIQQRINRIEQNCGIHIKDLLKVEISGLVYEQIQEIIQGRSISEIIENSDFYAANLLKVVKDVKQLAEKIVENLKLDKKNHLKHLIDVLAEIIKEDVGITD